MKFYRNFILCLIICLSFLLISCDNSTTNNKNDGDDADQPAIIEKVDLDGYEFIIRALVREGRYQLMPDPMEATLLEEKLLAHYAKTEEDFNCVITVDVADSWVAKVKSSQAVGDKYANVVDGWLEEGFPLIFSGSLLPLDDFEVFDDLYSGKWGNKNFLDTMVYNSEHYAFIPAYWGLPTPQFGNVLYFNPRIINDYQQPNPHELIEQKNWIWSKFKTMCENLYHLDEAGKPTGSINITNQNYVMKAAIASNGVKFAKQDETGRFIFNLDSPEAITAMDWVRECVVSEAFIANRSKPVAWVDDQFIAGETAFTVQWTYHGTTDQNSIAYKMEDEFNWAPFPVGPDGTHGQWGGAISHGTRYMFVTHSSYNEMSEFNILVNALYEPFEDMKKYDWRSIFGSQVFYKPMDQQIYFEMYETASYDFTGMITFPNMESIQKGTIATSEAVEKVKSASQASLDKNINAFLDVQ